MDTKELDDHYKVVCFTQFVQSVPFICIASVWYKDTIEIPKRKHSKTAS
jgi:hypothetical protein